MAHLLKNPHDAWLFLRDHPMVMDQDGDNRFHTLLDIDVVMVNPVTKTIDDIEALNTELRIRLEFGSWHKPEAMSAEEVRHMPEGIPSHDINLDCGAPTFEQAIMTLARNVLRFYGDY